MYRDADLEACHGQITVYRKRGRWHGLEHCGIACIVPAGWNYRMVPPPSSVGTSTSKLAPNSSRMMHGSSVTPTHRASRDATFSSKDGDPIGRPRTELSIFFFCEQAGSRPLVSRSFDLRMLQVRLVAAPAAGKNWEARRLLSRGLGRRSGGPRTRQGAARGSVPCLRGLHLAGADHIEQYQWPTW